MKTFRFDAADLKANRTGILSDKQQKQLKSAYTYCITISRLLALYIGAHIVVAVLPNSPNNTHEGYGLIFLSIVSAIAFIYSRRLKQDLTHSIVQSVTGTAQFVRGRSQSIAVRTANAEIQLSFYSRTHEAFDPNQMYTVYYLPTALWVTSLEQGPNIAPIIDNNPDQENQ